MNLASYLSSEPEDTGFTAYQEGRAAHRRGLPIDVNPYGMNTHESHEFCRGWGVEATVTRMGIS